MKDSEFMEQKISDVSIKELAEAIKMKIQRGEVSDYRAEYTEPEKDPNLFEDLNRKVIISSTGDSLTIYDTTANRDIYFGTSMFILEKAVLRAKELRGKK